MSEIEKIKVFFFSKFVYQVAGGSHCEEFKPKQGGVNGCPVPPQKVSARDVNKKRYPDEIGIKRENQAIFLARNLRPARR